MALFVCSRCGCVDLVELVFEGIFPPDADDQTCTECQTGQWHGQFPKERYCSEQDMVCNRETGLGFG